MKHPDPLKMSLAELGNYIAKHGPGRFDDAELTRAERGLYLRRVEAAKAQRAEALLGQLPDNLDTSPGALELLAWSFSDGPLGPLAADPRVDGLLDALRTFRRDPLQAEAQDRAAALAIDAINEARQRLA